MRKVRQQKTGRNFYYKGVTNLPLASRRRTSRLPWEDLPTRACSVSDNTQPNDAADKTATVRQVPYYISSEEGLPMFDPLDSIRELQKMTGCQDLLFEGSLVSVIGCEAMAYHPPSTVYVPPFLGQGIVTAAPSIQKKEGSGAWTRSDIRMEVKRGQGECLPGGNILQQITGWCWRLPRNFWICGQSIQNSGYGLKLADPIAFYDPDLFVRLTTPSGANLRVRKIGSNCWRRIHSPHCVSRDVTR